MIYQNMLKDALTKPGEFQGTPGFKFGFDTGMQAFERANSRNRGTGNALAEAVKLGTGYGLQDYGNHVDRLSRLSGQEQQYELGKEQNANSLQSSKWNYELGQGQNANAAQNNKWNYELGAGRNANELRSNDQNFGLNMYRANNDFELGQGRNANDANQSRWNYELGWQRNANDAAANQNNWNVNWFNANTNRGNAERDAWYRWNGGR